MVDVPQRPRAHPLVRKGRQWTPTIPRGTLCGMDETGAYRASRAAALSGVPERTVHDWANKKVVVPSVPIERIKLWSYADLMALRVVSWLRNPKPQAGRDVRSTPMAKVKKALATLQDYGLEIWSPSAGARVLVDSGGEVIVVTGGKEFVGDQVVERALLDLAAPFELFNGLRGPDLRRPRPHLRIIPGKLGGEPHVDHTRLESRAVAVLAARGFALDQLHELYPFASREVLEECISLEEQLEANAQGAAA
jgi:uncharacterized protein (DUF433 family)